MDKKFGISKQQTKTLKIMETVIKKSESTTKIGRANNKGKPVDMNTRRALLKCGTGLGRISPGKASGTYPGTRIKKLQCSFGKIEVPKHHILSKVDSKFGVSQYMSELMCHMGQEMGYEAASEAIEKLISRT